jgi:hypothetical protein
MSRVPAAFAAMLAALAATPTFAQGPEQLEQLEPDGGQWQLEYYGVARAHSVQALYGISARFALGVEVEGEARGGRLAIAGLTPTALYHFSDSDAAPFAVGVEVQAEFDPDLRLAGAEARLILERKGPRWWAQGNAMLLGAQNSGDWRVSVAYGAAASRAIAPGLWLGIEASGQPEHGGGHFAGPALTFEDDAGGAEAEIGLAYQRRIVGDGPSDSLRVFVQLNL